MMQKAKGRFAIFVTQLTAVVDALGDDEAALVPRVGALLQSLVRNDDWLHAEHAAPHPAHYQQYLLHCDPLSRFSIVSFVWGAGQQTPIHDHTTWGLIGMLRGSEVSQQFEIIDGIPVRGDEERLDPGDIALVSPRVGDIHQVRNAHNDRVSISIHVYGNDIGAIERLMYPLVGGRRSFISGYANWSARGPLSVA